MAYNWTLAEAVKEFEQNNTNNIMDIGKRMPLLANLLSRAVSGDAKAAVEILGKMPPKMTANVINGYLKDGVGAPVAPDGTVQDAGPSATAAVPAAAPAAAPGELPPGVPAGGIPHNVSNMSGWINTVTGKGVFINKKGVRFPAFDGQVSAAKLYELCKARGLQIQPRLKPEDYVNALATGAVPAAAPAAPDAAPVAAPAPAANLGKYAGMIPQDLYKLCKQRNIAVEIKQPVEYYANALMQADAAAAAPAPAPVAADDGWDTPAPAAPAAPAPSPAPAPASDEWTI